MAFDQVDGTVPSVVMQMKVARNANVCVSESDGKLVIMISKNFFYFLTFC